MRSLLKALGIVVVGTLLASDAAAQTETRFTVIDSSPSSWVARG